MEVNDGRTIAEEEITSSYYPCAATAVQTVCGCCRFNDKSFF